MMLYTMVELIHTLSYIRTRKLHCCLCLLRILLNMLMRLKNKPPTDIAKNNGIKLKGGAFLATTPATAELCDNESAIKLTNNPVQHARTKHIDVRHQQKGDICIESVGSEDQLADIFTKPLDEKRFCKLRNELNILDFSNMC